MINAAVSAEENNNANQLPDNLIEDEDATFAEGNMQADPPIPIHAVLGKRKREGESIKDWKREFFLEEIQESDIADSLEEEDSDEEESEEESENDDREIEEFKE